MGDVIVPIIMQLAAEQAEQGAVVLSLVAHQQVQACTGDAGNEFGPGEGATMGVLGVKDDENTADGLHGRELPW